MRYYNAEQQLLQLLFSHLAEGAKAGGVSPAALLADVVRDLPRATEEGALPDALCDNSRTPEERYAWLCAQMERFSGSEASRRADFRMASEARGLSVLDRLIDAADLPQSMRLLREGEDTFLLALTSDDTSARGIRLFGVRDVQGALHAPLLRTSAELSLSGTDAVTLAAMSMQGEVSVTFTGAAEAETLYDYAQAADAMVVLWPAFVRTVYRLHKLCEKALDPDVVPVLSDGEKTLLPIALCTSLFYGNAQSVPLILRHLPHSASAEVAALAEGEIEREAATTLAAVAVACGDMRAARLLAPLTDGGSGKWRKRRARRRFAAHYQSARGEVLCRALDAALADATACYPAPLLLAEQGGDIESVRQTVDTALSAAGYTGAWPHYRREEILSVARLFVPDGVHARILPRGTRVLALIDCEPFLQNGTLCVNFSCGTIPLSRGEGADSYIDSGSACFDPMHRRTQRFAAGPVIGADAEAAGLQLTLAETAVAAAKSAMLTPLDTREHQCVVHANPIPLWRVGVVCGMRTLVLGACFGLVLRFVPPLFGASLSVAVGCGTAGVICGVVCGLYRLVLALVGRKKL